ncbi:protein YgfX [Salinicola halimionae]|uniref:protein YgfX n=1 Tax=Salinicola halimionae TaxID=1949081 RepID=UPI000DA25A01|nr:protein YgfX [Salinicola halimionae]
MPKPSTVVVIRRSRLSLAVQVLLGLVLASYAGWWLDYRIAAVVALTAAGLGYRHYLALPRRRYLRRGQANGHAVWESSPDGRVWQSERCQWVRLGPLLSALDLSGQRLWLWPDSSDAESLRHLREALSEQSDGSSE